jgi:hypothetical protein
LQEPAALADLLHAVLQHQADISDPGPFIGAPHPLKPLLQLPAAQDIAPADFASALKLSLQRGHHNCSKLLLEQPVACALEAAHVFELLVTVLQHRAWRYSTYSFIDVWMLDAEQLLALPAASELDTDQIEHLLQQLLSLHGGR